MEIGKNPIKFNLQLWKGTENYWIEVLKINDNKLLAIFHYIPQQHSSSLSFSLYIKGQHENIYLEQKLFIEL